MATGVGHANNSAGFCLRRGSDDTFRVPLQTAAMTIRVGLLGLAVTLLCGASVLTAPQATVIGRELAIARHLRDGEEVTLPMTALLDFGRQLFSAAWTDQDGGGRPLSKGNGQPLADRSQPLVKARAFNRLSGPDANACSGCHVGPYQAAGGGGDFVANAFVMADRFDFVTFARGDTKPTRGAVDEGGRPATLQSVGNSRLTPGLWGAGFLEMLARQMSGELRRIRDSLQPGESKRLVSKGVSFGSLSRRVDGTWIVDLVEGLPRQSVALRGPGAKPSLLIYPWRQSGSVVSLRDITNTSFNQHHGMQSTERFGVGTDPDGDGIVNELTRADITAVTLWQATLPVPGRVIPNLPDAERTLNIGERLFAEMRCSSCHVPALPLASKGWVYSEPNPYNASRTLAGEDGARLHVDLTMDALPQPRLHLQAVDLGMLPVPAYTDFKLHDITDPADSEAAEPLDINEPPRSPAFLRGNRKFLTRRLWAIGNQSSYFHHGLFTSLKQAVLAHAGEALQSRLAFQRATKEEQDSVLEFLRSLQVLPPGTRGLVVDERFQPKLTRD
jgi:hypothetical protein